MQADGPAIVLAYDQGRKQVFIKNPDPEQSGWAVDQLRQNCHAVFERAFTDNEVHPDRLRYAFVAKVFIVQTPRPIGGKRRPGFLEFVGETADDAVDWILTLATLPPVRKGKRRPPDPGSLLRFVVSALNEVLGLHVTGRDKDGMDDAVMRGMRRAGQLDMADKIYLPEHLRESYRKASPAVGASERLLASNGIASFVPAMSRRAPPPALLAMMEDDEDDDEEEDEDVEEEDGSLAGEVDEGAVGTGEDGNASGKLAKPRRKRVPSASSLKAVSTNPAGAGRPASVAGNFEDLAPLGIPSAGLPEARFADQYWSQAPKDLHVPQPTSANGNYPPMPTNDFDGPRRRPSDSSGVVRDRSAASAEGSSAHETKSLPYLPPHFYRRSRKAAKPPASVEGMSSTRPNGRPLVDDAGRMRKPQPDEGDNIFWSDPSDGSSGRIASPLSTAPLHCHQRPPPSATLPYPFRPAQPRVAAPPPRPAAPDPSALTTSRPLDTFTAALEEVARLRAVAEAGVDRELAWARREDALIAELRAARGESMPPMGGGVDGPLQGINKIGPAGGVGGKSVGRVAGWGLGPNQYADMPIGADLGAGGGQYGFYGDPRAPALIGSRPPPMRPPLSRPADSRVYSPYAPGSGPIGILGMYPGPGG
ncbi:hypothetical protein HK101_006346 [Irineochytrium annulatum]|nr:hypothetical protein HK101_006346 [Irineochytrium annulatum]